MISLYLLNYLLVQPKMKKFLGGPKHLKKKHHLLCSTEIWSDMMVNKKM